jgi:hypothetical protein
LQTPGTIGSQDPSSDLSVIKIEENYRNSQITKKLIFLHSRQLTQFGIILS